MKNVYVSQKIEQQLPEWVSYQLWYRLSQLLHELFAVLVPQQILKRLLLQTGSLLHGVDDVLHSLTDM